MTHHVTAPYARAQGGRDDAFGGRDLADFEDENEAIWRNSIGVCVFVRVCVCVCALRHGYINASNK